MSAIPQVRRINFDDQRIGMGFNSESGLAVGTALDGFQISKDPTAPGQDVSASITIVNTHEELMSRLGMSFEAQGRYGFVSGGAKVEFAEQSSYSPHRLGSQRPERIAEAAVGKVSGRRSHNELSRRRARGTR